MKMAIAVTVFIVVVALAIAGRWFGMIEGLTMYNYRNKPLISRRFSLSTLLLSAIGLAVGFGLFMLWIRRG
jgi:hypothetical protein